MLVQYENIPSVKLAYCFQIFLLADCVFRILQSTHEGVVTVVLHDYISARRKSNKSIIFDVLVCEGCVVVVVR